MKSETFIDGSARTLRKTAQDLSPQQVNIFFEACGHMILISAQVQKIRSSYSYDEKLVHMFGEILKTVSKIISFIVCQPKARRVPRKIEKHVESLDVHASSA